MDLDVDGWDLSHVGTEESRDTDVNLVAIQFFYDVNVQNTCELNTELIF